MNQIMSMINRKEPAQVETRFSAFNRLAARYQDEAYTLAFYLLGDDARAARVIQTALADLYRGAQIPTENFRLELLRQIIAHCDSLDYAARNRALGTSPAGDPLRRELLLLKTNQRWAAVLVDVLGLGYEEAARVLGCSSKQITHWLAEARLNLATGSTQPVRLTSS